MKKLFLLLLLLIPTFAVFGQITDEEAQLFGSRRGEIYSFGQISDVVQHSFYIENKSPTTMQIVKVTAPDGIKAVMKNRIINPNDKGELVITVYPSQFQTKGDFQGNVVVTIEQENALGKTTKQQIFTISGTVK